MLTHFQYLDSLKRLNITDADGMVMFFASRFMVTHR